MNKRITSAIVTVLTVLAVPTMASAHVVVKPGDVPVATFNTFTMGVPNEKDMPVTSVKLLIPDNLKSVTPTTKPGWTIETEKVGEGKGAKTVSITWTGGTVESGRRDDFTFSAQAPATAGNINWKAYETYQDGTVATWDQSPTGGKEVEGKGPFSVTKVVNDLEPVAAVTTTAKPAKTDTLALLVAGIALLIALANVLFGRRKTA